MDRRTRIVAASIAALAIAGAAGSGIALAVTSDDDRTSPPAVAQEARDEHPAAGRFLDRLAEKLGVERTALDEAIRASASELLDEAAAESEVPPALETALRRAIADFPDIASGADALKDVLRNTLPRPPADGPADAGTVIARLAASLRTGTADLAAFLGMSEAELRAALGRGQSLAGIAEAHGVAREALRAYLEAEALERIREAAAAGALPPAVTALIEAQVSGLIERLLDAGRP